MHSINIVRPIRNWAHRLRGAFTSKEAFLAYIHTEGNAHQRHTWTNEDLKPSPPSMVNWKWYNFCIFWFGMGFGNWTLGSSLVDNGLSWWEATIAIWIAAFVSGACMALNSRAAANYHVGYPVILRTCFGMYGHYWPVLARGVCACLWVSVITFEGGAFISTMLHCVVGHRWKNLPTQFPASVGTTVQRFAGFVIFWAIVLPFCSLRPTRLKWLYNFKAWVLPPSVMGLLIYCLVQSKGRLASTAALAGESASTLPKGSTLAWLFVSSVNSCMGNWSTFIANMPDFARYSDNPNAVLWTHVLFVPFPAALGGMIGVFGTAALQHAWGETIWNQWDVYDAMLAHNFSGGMRFFVFLLAFSSGLFNFGALIGANLLPFSSDITALFPRYFNIPRGMWFCGTIALALQPWKILASSQGFLAFLDGYGIFMGPTAAIMITDYWIVRKGNIRIMEAYSSKRGATYMYWHGVNLNAAFAYLCGMMVPFVGFVGTFGVSVPEAATKLDKIGWYLSAAIAGVVYVGMCRIRPLANVDRDLPREQLAREFARQREMEVEEVTGSVDGVEEKEIDVEEEDGKKADAYVVSYSPTMEQV
ncbi:uncharacterized protein LAESUDRAFT_664425 [Laetiporus sulphureus 93-53]|uniref:NCS1 nucleoside transporter family n=1 Tax=Laetiporus sulphureus 93-53 TaxID=1314785 RepID=A0A165BJY5_9APHY|nr:uncharacterized protein LAESUDRAFT_664425 [Laetiporus sulphureus 93-53]KZT01199.1 hypothetical protein LAESUDRAFT_664425 [Laetiporus sulphureus 93-53]